MEKIINFSTKITKVGCLVKSMVGMVVQQICMSREELSTERKGSQGRRNSMNTSLCAAEVCVCVLHM